MTPPKNPTNSDILKEIREVTTLQKAQGRDIETLMEWKRAEDAYRAALKAVRGEEADDANRKQDAQLKSTAIKVLTQLSPILAALGILLYAFTGGSH